MRDILILALPEFPAFLHAKPAYKPQHKTKAGINA
jgi:hypothetical protein